MPPRAERSRSRDPVLGRQERRALLSEGRSRLTFGRHQGERYSAVRRSHPGYCSWALGVPQPSGQLRHFVAWLQRRRVADAELSGEDDDTSDESEQEDDEDDDNNEHEDSDESNHSETGPTIADLLAGGPLAGLMNHDSDVIQHGWHVLRTIAQSRNAALQALAQSRGAANASSSQQGARSRPSASVVLEQLPRIPYSANLFSGNPHPTACPICIEEWSDVSGDIVLTPCLHVFHETCLRGWLDRRCLDCPSCRWDISKLGDQGMPSPPGGLVERPVLGDLAGTTITIDEDSQD
eukprot:TRINITY_DN23786_c0_g1_i1.p1 TRINITY_DN23786_c0_g1~~TRINITY_DN23786_c0_g1_i1.p1  ORF type:complete len:301 (+),score=18.08 TRINITY_DN23786_c0_g1_i1:23-904(+)